MDNKLTWPKNPEKLNIAAKSKNINANFLTQDYFDIMWLNYHNFHNKNLVSIGWGFWVLEADLAINANTQVEIVDPIFQDKDSIEDVIQKNINWVNNQKLELNTTVSELDILDILDNNWAALYYEELEKIERNRKKIKTNSLKDKLVEHLKKWQDWEFNEFLVINSSFGQEILNVEDNSQDFVLINHTLSHLKSLEKVVLSEADKILSNSWKIIIIDYKWDIKNIEDTFSHKISWDLWGSVCYILNKWDYKKLD